VNYGVVAKVIGNLLIIEAAGMLLPFFVSMYYGQHDRVAFSICIAITAIAGFLLSRIPQKNKTIKIKEGFAIVSLGWILASVFGSMPFIVSGSIRSFADAFFETVSGFTTTGATVVADVEILPYGILFWRSFTHWIGGMGILVFTLAILPAMGVGGYQIFKAETPGPIAGRIVPKIKDTAKILYVVYVGLTLSQIILLRLGGMNLFDSAVHTFGTVGTGGFSTKNTSIGYYNSTYIYLVISIFMVLSGVNFSLYYALLKGKWKDVIKNEELLFYLGVIGVSVILIALSINANIYNNIGESLKQSFFQVSSVITTTGYATTDYDKWTTFSKGILFTLLFFGPCAGSTGGAIKSIRLLVLLKLIKREISKALHPRAIIPVKIGQNALSSETLSGISSFFVLYIVVFVLGTIALSLEGKGLITASSAAAATLGNVGPGFELVGPACNYNSFSNISKYIMSGLMLLGRLELFTVIALFSREFWRGEL
jgi:trk system potassium uptake protein TrkH